MPQITYSRNWRGPRPGVSTFSIETSGTAEAIIIEDVMLQFLMSDKGPLEALSNYEQQPKGPTYLEFLQTNKHFLNKLQFQFCNAVKDYTGNPFELNLVTKTVTIEQEAMRDLVKGAFPGKGVPKPSVNVTNIEDVLPFWVSEALARKKKVPPSKLFSMRKKKQDTSARSGADDQIGSGLTSASILAQNESSTEDHPEEMNETNGADVPYAARSEEPKTNTKPNKPNAFRKLQNLSRKPQKELPQPLPVVDTKPQKKEPPKDPRVVSMHEIFGDLVEEKSKQHRLLLVSLPSTRDELITKFSWVPKDPELTAESRSRSIRFDLLDVNFSIICVLPEDFPRSLAFPWPFRSICFYDGLEASPDPMPSYLPDLQRVHFESLDLENDLAFYNKLINGSPPPATAMINSMRGKFSERKRILEENQQAIEQKIATLRQSMNSSRPKRPVSPTFVQTNGSTKPAKTTCDFDLACRVMRCPGICISNCEVLEKDSEGFFYYQLPGSTERIKKCTNCTCSLSLHKVQPRAASLVNKPFSLDELKNPSADTNQSAAEARRKREEAEQQRRTQETYQTHLREWNEENQKRGSENVKAESELESHNSALEKLTAELVIVLDCLARWDAALQNWNEKNLSNGATN